MPQETRQQFTEELRALERQTMEGLEMVAAQVDRAVAAVERGDIELTEAVVAGDDRIDIQYRTIHSGLMSLMARQAPVAGDLRIAAALMYVSRCMERMGDQCVNMAKLVPLAGHDGPEDREILEFIEKMGTSARRQVRIARESFETRNLALVEELVSRDQEVNRLNREVFKRAVEAGRDPELREWAMFMVLVARCLERIGDNTVDIAEQTGFVVTGAFRGAADEQAQS